MKETTNVENKKAVLPTRTHDNNQEIAEYTVSRIAKYLQERLGISKFAAQQRVYRGIQERMVLEDRFEKGKLIEADAVKLGGRWLIRRHAALRLFVHSQHKL